LPFSDAWAKLAFPENFAYVTAGRIDGPGSRAKGDQQMDTVEELNAKMMPFARLLGMRITSATPDRLQAELKIREELRTSVDVAHGGCLMAFADTMGGMATFLNLPDGAATTTLESKTNFLSGAPAGTRITGETTPIHRGRTTMVWQTRITSETGKLVALVTQTQMVLLAR
jgi:1,4-dihydroxy-2-naphthoyl-CoA hydrolase